MAKKSEQVDEIRKPYSPDDLKKIRESFGWSKSEMIRMLGVPKNTYLKRESGESVKPNASFDRVVELFVLLRKNEPMVFLNLMSGMYK